MLLHSWLGGRSTNSRNQRALRQRPLVERLEDRLPPGDAISAGLLASGLIPDRGAGSTPAALSGQARRVAAPASSPAAPAFAFLEVARADLGLPATGTVAAPGTRASREAASDAWPEWATLAVSAAAPVRLTNPALSLSAPSVGSAAGPVSGLPEHAPDAARGQTPPLPLAPATTRPFDQALLTAASGVRGQPAASGRGSERPNFVFILTDDTD